MRERKGLPAALSVFGPDGLVGTAAHFLELARALGVNPRYVQKLAREVGDAVQAAMPAAAAEVLPLLAPGQQVLMERITNKVSSIARRMRKRITGDDPGKEDAALKPEPMPD